MSDNKTGPTEIDPRAHVAALDHPGRRADAEKLIEMMARLTGEKPRMWGPTIVGFGRYHYRYDSGREGEAPVAGFAPRKAETVVYLVGEIPDQAVLLARLGKHRTGKACLYIKRLEDVDIAVLEELIVKSIAAIRAKYPEAT